MEPRAGSRPRTVGPAPHAQIDQTGPAAYGETLLRRAAALPGVTVADSLVSVPGARAFHLDGEQAQGPPEAFVAGREFGHLHPPHDSSLHLVLPPEVAAQAVAAGWAEPHPEVPRLFLVYGPRDESEVEQVWRLLEAAYRYAAGASSDG